MTPSSVVPAFNSSSAICIHLVRRDSISSKSFTTTTSQSIHDNDDTSSNSNSNSSDDEEHEEFQGFIPQQDNTSRSDDTIPSTPSSKSPYSFDASANHSDYSNATSIQDEEEDDDTKLDHKHAEKQQHEIPTTDASSFIETKDLPAIPTTPSSCSSTTQSHQEKPHPPKPAAIDTSTTTSSRLFGIWSSIKSASGRWPSQQQQQSSQQTAMIIEHHDKERHSNRLSQQQRSVSEPDLGHEDILTQMENLNIANTSDPKVRMLVGLKRQSVRDSLKSQYLGRDDFDWGKFK